MRDNYRKFASNSSTSDNVCDFVNSQTSRWLIAPPFEGRLVEAGLPNWIKNFHGSGSGVPNNVSNQFREYLEDQQAGGNLNQTLEQSGKNFLRPVMQTKNKILQQELAQSSQDSGKSLGAPWALGSPANSLQQMKGMQMRSPYFPKMIPILGSVIQNLSKTNPRISQMMSEDHFIGPGVFDVECDVILSTGTSGTQWTKKTLDLLDISKTLNSEEFDRLPAYIKKLSTNPVMKTADVMNLCDQAIAKHNLGMQVGPNTAAWVESAIKPAATEMASEAKRVGQVNMLTTIHNWMSAGVAAFAVGAVSMVAHGIGKPSNAQMDQALPQNTATQSLYSSPNIGTTSNPGAAFGDNNSAVSAPGSMSTGGSPVQPVPQQYSTQPTPQVDFSSVMPNQAPNITQYWNRGSNVSSAKHVLAQVNDNMTTPTNTTNSPTNANAGAFSQKDLQTLLNTTPTFTDLTSALDEIIQGGDGPVTYRAIANCLSSLQQHIAPLSPVIQEIASPAYQSVASSPVANSGPVHSAMSQQSNQRVASPLDTIIDVAKSVLPDKPASSAHDAVGSNDVGDSYLDKDTAPLKQLNDQDQDASSAGESVGLDRQRYEMWVQAFKEASVVPEAIAPFISQVIGYATQASFDVEQTLRLACFIVRRATGDVKRAEQILATLAKYESEAPGIGIFSVAIMAMNGQPFQQALTTVRLALIKDIKNGTGNTQDLSQAIYGIQNPNSPLGAFMDNVLMQNQRMKQQIGYLGIDIARVKAQWQQLRQQYLSGVYRNFQEKLPGLSRSSWFQNIMQLLEGVSGSLAILDTIRRGIGFGPDKGLLGRGMSHVPTQASENLSKSRRFAQSTTQDQNSYSPNQQTNGGYNPTPQMGSYVSQDSQRATQLQQGQPNPSYNAQEASDEQKWMSWLNIQLQTATKASDNFNQAFQQLVASLSAGQGQDAGGLGAAPFMLAQNAMEQGGNLEAMGGEAYKQVMQAYQAVSGVVKAGNAKSTTVNNYLQSVVQQLQSLAREVYFKKIAAAEFAVVAPIQQQIRQMESQVQVVQRQIARAQKHGLSMSPAVGQYVGYCFQIAKLWEQVMSRFATIAQSSPDPTIQQWAQTEYKMAWNQADLYKGQASDAVSDLKQSKWGAGVNTGLSAITTGRLSANSNRITRFASEVNVKLADKEIEDYYNSLYGDTDARGYGTLLEHVEDHHTDTSEEVEPESAGKSGQAEHIENKLKRRRFR